MAKVIDRSDLPGVGRLLSLSDGVVAIALTLLVLNLHAPDPASLTHPNSASELAHALSLDGAVFTSYLVSFYVIAQFWLAHHRVFRLVAGHDEGLAWWNFAFLFAITLMPFTADLMGEFPDNPLAIDIFALNLLIASFSTQLVVYFGRRHGVLVPGIDPLTLRASRLRSAGVAAVVLVSMAVAWVNTDAAKYVWLLLLVVSRLADRTARTKEAGPPGPSGQRAATAPG